MPNPLMPEQWLYFFINTSHAETVVNFSSEFSFQTQMSIPSHPWIRTCKISSLAASSTRSSKNTIYYSRFTQQSLTCDCLLEMYMNLVKMSPEANHLSNQKNGFPPLDIIFTLSITSGMLATTDLQNF